MFNLSKLFVLISKQKIILKNYLNFNLIYFNNTIVQIVLIPLLIRNYGLSEYGSYVFIYSIVNYSEIFIRFGFDYYLLRMAVENRANLLIINNLYNVSVVSRFGVLIILLVFMNLLFGIIDIKIFSIVIFNILFLSLFKVVFIPQWYFQSKNSLSILSIASFFANIFLIISSLIIFGNDLSIKFYAYAVLLSSLVQIVIVQLRIWPELKLSVAHIHATDIANLFSVSYVNMLSEISQLYTNFTKIILGILFTPNLVAIYEISIRIVNFIKTPFIMFNNAIYPEAIRRKNISRSGRNLLYEILAIAAVIIILHYVKPYIYFYFTGEMSPSYNYLLTLLSITIIAVVSNQVLGFHILYNFGYDSIRSRGIIYSSVLYIILLFIYYYMALDSTIFIFSSLLVVEFVSSIYYVIKIYSLKEDIQRRCAEYTE